MDLENAVLAKSALITVDIQNDFCHPNGVFGRAGTDLSFIQQTVPKMNDFLTAVRNLRTIPVIHVRTVHSDWTASPAWRQRAATSHVPPFCQPETWGSDFYEIVRGANEYVVAKHRYSAFVNTDLELVLRSQGIRTLVLIGLNTNVCIESTARDAAMKDYYVVLVEDCLAALTVKEHEAALFNLGNYFGIVSDSATLLNTWEKSKGEASAVPL